MEKIEKSVSCKDLYLDLMVKCLINEIYGDAEYVTTQAEGRFSQFINRLITSKGLRIIKNVGFDSYKREKGLDWPPYAHTMVGRKRLENLRYCAEKVIQENIPGDFIETGVWRGGATIFMRAILKAYNIDNRNVWVADSFEGLPAPNSDKYPADKGDIHHTIHELKVDINTVMSNFRKYELLDGQVKFLKGWFKDTLPTAPISQLAIARLDGDMYESTMDAIATLYPKLSPGGFLIVDDYCIEMCKKAIIDYRIKNNIEDQIVDIDGTGVFWRKAM